jgi:hypothetical protein
MISIKDRIIKVAERLDWSVEVTNDNQNLMTFEFSKRSLTGGDFRFEAILEDGDVEEFLNDILNYYWDYDVSYETYIWLGKDGHGVNGAPDDIKNIYEDREACIENVYALYCELCGTNWECEYNVVFSIYQKQKYGADIITGSYLLAEGLESEDEVMEWINTHDCSGHKDDCSADEYFNIEIEEHDKTGKVTYVVTVD